MEKFEIPVVSDTSFTVDEREPNAHIVTFNRYYMTYKWIYSGYDVKDTDDDVLRGILEGQYRSYDGISTLSVDKFCSVCVSFNTEEELYDLSVRFDGDAVLMRHTDKPTLENIANKCLEWHESYMSR